MTALDAKDISLKYAKTNIIEHLDCSIEKGKITTLIEKNGCGKSTLLKGFSRLIPNHSGSIIINQEPMQTLSQKALTKKLAFLPQDQQVIPQLAIYDLISYGRYPHQSYLGFLSDKDKETIDWAIEMTNIQELKDKTVDSLSGGQRQKVYIALALAQDTDIILLDEPTTYLDLNHQLEVLELLKELNQKTQKTILMVLHNLNLASRFSDHLIAMKNGKIKFQGSPEEVFNRTMLKEIFNIQDHIIMDEYSKRPLLVTYHLLH